MTEVILVVVGVLALIAVYFIFFAKKGQGAAEIEGKPEPKALQTKSAERKPERVSPSVRAGESTPRSTKEGAKSSERPAERKQEEETVRPSKAKADSVKPEPKAEKATEPQAPESEPEPAPEPAKPTPVAEEQVGKRGRDVAGVRKGLGKARSSEGFFGRLAKLITGRTEIDPALADELEEVLLSSDVGVATTSAVLDRIRGGLGRKEIDDPDKVWGALRQEARRIVSLGTGGLVLRHRPTVVLMVGVNGSGKTTTIGKLATQLKAEGKKVVLAAGDTFRAAAVQQLEVWGKRVGCDVVRGKDGADPSAVIFDAIQKATEAGADVVLADTAGRLHTKVNLMDELKKIAKTTGKAAEGAPHEVLLVIDATNGQNAMAQSRQFSEALALTGIVLTKLDGTAKGGVVLGICDELKVPIRYIGLGERADDLRTFDPDEFVEALLGETDADEAAA